MQRIPVLGGIYEACLRNNTSYYREDTRQLFAGVVETIIRAEVERLAEDNGIDEVSFSSVSDPESPKSLLDQNV